MQAKAKKCRAKNGWSGVVVVIQEVVNHHFAARHFFVFVVISTHYLSVAARGEWLRFFHMLAAFSWVGILQDAS
jgi:hypothetical protein